LSGTISTVAGSGLPGFSGDGGPALVASLASPTGLAVDAAGNIFVADFAVSRIRKIDVSGLISTVAGNGQYKPSPDCLAGPDTAIRSPWGITTVADGSIVFAERTAGRIRKVGPDGTVSTIAGTGVQGITGDGGKALAAQLSLPEGVAVGPAGIVYFSEETNFKVREVSPDGIISTEAGNGLVSPTVSDGIPATDSALAIPDGIALDAAGNLYLADAGPNVIRKISQSGIISTVAGNG
jgi:sugar lactone lactonase YvrE